METILVADDEPAILEFLTTLLEDEGYRALPAIDGLAALEGLGSHEVELAIVDAMMPRLGGVGLIRAMRESAGLRGIPVILISAAVTPSLDGLGECRFLAKPFDLVDLLDAVQHAIAGSS